jgi:hypothetical protein
MLNWLEGASHQCEMIPAFKACRRQFGLSHVCSGVKSGNHHRPGSLPLCPQQQTLARAPGRSVLCHKLTRTSLRAISGFSELYFGQPSPNRLHRGRRLAAHRTRKSYPGCLSAPENKCSTSRSHPLESLRGHRLQVPRPPPLLFGTMHRQTFIELRLHGWNIFPAGAHCISSRTH